MLVSEIALQIGNIHFQALYEAILKYNMHQLGIKLHLGDSKPVLSVVVKCGIWGCQGGLLRTYYFMTVLLLFFLLCDGTLVSTPGHHIYRA